MIKCNICGDLKYVVKDGERVACKCITQKHLYIYAPEQFVSAVKVPQAIRDKLWNMFKAPIDNAYMSMGKLIEEDVVNSMILYFLVSHLEPHYKILNVYELIEIYLSRHPHFKSLYELKFPAVVMLEGYNEFPNVRQNDAILQYLDIAAGNKSKVLYLSRKTAIDTPIMDYFKTHNWTNIIATAGTIAKPDGYGKL